MRLLSTLLLVLASVAWGGVSGHVSAQGQGLSLTSSDPLGTTQQSASLMLQEAVGIHYSGMPFGRSVALVTAGLEGVNANSWGSNGVTLSGRSATLDLSVGLFPRRALPLRIYARGTISESSGQSVITLGGRESLLYGLSLNFDPRRNLPGLRLEAQEQRSTALGSSRTLGDVYRVFGASVYKAFGDSQLNVGAQLRQDEREAVGSFTSVLVNGAFTAPTHQTNVVFTQADRRPATAQLIPGGAATDRQARVSHGRRWQPALITDANARVTDSRFVDGSGTQAALGLGGTWKALEAHDLMFSASADLGVTRTRAAAVEGTGYVAGGGARVGYSRPVNRLVAGGALGSNLTWCDCLGDSDGLKTALEGSVTLATLDFERFDGRADYRVAWVAAPQSLGGNRLEHHARVQTRTQVRPVSVLFTLGYDDGVREFADVTTGTIVPFTERVFVGAVGGVMPVQKGSVSAEVRHARGASFSPPTPFVNAPPLSARAVTNILVQGTYPVQKRVDARGGGTATWTVLGGNQTLFTAGLEAAVSAHFGRLTGTLSYQYFRTDVSGVASNQHTVRLFLTRPFSL